MTEGWQSRALGDVCEVIAGQSPDGTCYNDAGIGMPFYQGKKDFGERFLEAPTTWTTQTTKVARAGDLLMSVRAPVGPVNVTLSDVCIGRGLAAIRSGPELADEFLYYHLLYLQPRISGTDGAVFASISKSGIEHIPIPLPPLPEQHRIVAILDEAFEALAIARANTEQNLKSARVLFESHLDSVFTQRRHDWTMKPLSGVCRFTNGLWKGESPPYATVGVIRNTNFTKRGTLNDAEIAYIEVEARKLSTRRLQYGDIILEKSGGGPKQAVGRVALFDKDAGDFSFSNFTAALRVNNPNELAFSYLHRYLHWTYLSGATEQMQSHSTGIRNLDGDAYKAVEVWFPSLLEQRRIVAGLECLEAETDRLESLYQQKLDALANLRESILHHAFTGQL